MHQNALSKIQDLKKKSPDCYVFHSYFGDQLALYFGICPSCGGDDVEDEEKVYFFKLVKSFFGGVKCKCNECGDRHTWTPIRSD